jgi:aqualysin 1
MTVRLLLYVLAVALSSLPLSAQQQDSHRVIVVLKEGVNLKGFAKGVAQNVPLPAESAYLDQDVVGAIQGVENRHKFKSEHMYSHALRGFAATLSTRQIEDLKNESLVDYIEPDGVMTAIAQTLPWGIHRVGADLSSTLAGNGSGAVTNVNVYVIDTGIDKTHPDLNVVNFVNFTKDHKNTDCNGHGSHVAGTIAARDNTSYVVGVAPGAPLSAVKVLGCNGSGTTSGVIAGIDWVTANAKKPAVANMSLGGSASQTLDDAVKRSTAAGIVYAIAAGNSGADACTQSPARVGTTAGVITVAATDSADREASWSNYGSCVDLWAPGVNILSTYMGSTTATMSGTSMASPHVAGAVALLLSQQSTLTPANAEASLKNGAFSTTTLSKDGRAIKIVNASVY